MMKISGVMFLTVVVMQKFVPCPACVLPPPDIHALEQQPQQRHISERAGHHHQKARACHLIGKRSDKAMSFSHSYGVIHAASRRA